MSLHLELVWAVCVFCHGTKRPLLTVVFFSSFFSLSACLFLESHEMARKLIRKSYIYIEYKNIHPSVAAMKLSPAWPASHHTFQSPLCFPESAKNMIMLLNIILLVTFWSISSSSEETFISAFLSCALSLAISIALALCLPARVSPALASWSSAPVLVSSYFCSPAVCLGWGVSNTWARYLREEDTC